MAGDWGFLVEEVAGELRVWHGRTSPASVRDVRLWQPNDPGRSCLHSTIRHHATSQTGSQDDGALGALEVRAVTWQQAKVDEASEGGTVRYRDANPIQRFLRRSAATAPASWLYARVLHHADRLAYRRTRGRHTLSSRLSGLPVVMLTTTGAKTGQRRTTVACGPASRSPPPRRVRPWAACAAVLRPARGTPWPAPGSPRPP